MEKEEEGRGEGGGDRGEGGGQARDALSKLESEKPHVHKKLMADALCGDLSSLRQYVQSVEKSVGISREDGYELVPKALWCNRMMCSGRSVIEAKQLWRSRTDRLGTKYDIATENDIKLLKVPTATSVKITEGLKRKIEARSSKDNGEKARSLVDEASFLKKQGGRGQIPFANSGDFGNPGADVNSADSRSGSNDSKESRSGPSEPDGSDDGSEHGGSINGSENSGDSSGDDSNDGGDEKQDGGRNDDGESVSNADVEEESSVDVRKKKKKSSVAGSVKKRVQATEELFEKIMTAKSQIKKQNKVWVFRKDVQQFIKQKISDLYFQPQ